jgi:YVTN family beta-propeller protein
MPSSFSQRWAGLFLITLAASGSTSAQKLVPVNYPGAVTSQIFAINNRGVSVGTGPDHAFILSNGTFTNIDVPGGVETQPFGINDNGDVVGAYFDPSFTQQHGFLLKAGAYTTIDYPGASGTQARGINNAGQIVGEYSTPGHTHGFRLIAGVFSTLDCSCGASVTTELLALNNNGTIVGGYVDAGGVTRGLKYSAGTFTTINFPGSSATLIDGINDAGTLSGTFLDPADHIYKGFETINGKYSTIGPAPEPSNGVWYVVVNNSGQIAGSTYDPTIAISFNGPGFFVSTAPLAYVALSSTNSVAVFDTAFNLPVVTIPVGANPIGVAVNPKGTSAYVVNHNSNSISVIDATTQTTVATILVGSSPVGVAVTPDGSRVYVANNFSNSVSVISTSSNSVVATVAVGSVPTLLATTPDGKFVYVTNQFSANVSVISTLTNTVVAAIPVGPTPVGVAVTPDGKFAYVTCCSNSVVAINTSTNSVTATIPVGAAPVRISITPDGSMAYVSNQNSGNVVTVINLANNSVLGTVIVGSTPYGSAPTPDGAFVWETNAGSNNISVISTSTDAVVATIPLSTSATDLAIGPAPPTSQSLTQPLSPSAPNQFNFGPHTFAVQYPSGTSFSGVNMTVVVAQDGQLTFKQRVAGTPFANATCIVYAGAGGNCVDYKVTCSNTGGNAITCPSVSTPSISVKTSFDTQEQIINPGFLTTPIGTNNWTNIFDSFYLQRIDPTMKGRTRGFSEFVAVDLGVSNAQGLGKLTLLGPLQQNEARVFPVGTLIPVEFQLASQAHSGVSISDAIAGITVVQSGNANGNPVSKIVLQQPNAFSYVAGIYTYFLNTTGYAPGGYDVTIYGNAFVAREVQFIIPGPMGDLNGDGIVNCADLAIVRGSFGKKTGHTGFDPRADVNKDGIVNILDLSTVAKQLPAGTACK